MRILACTVLSVAFCLSHAFALGVSSELQVSASSSPQQHFEEGYVKEYNAGISFLRRGDESAALTALKAAIALKPDAKEAHYALGVVYLRLGETSLAKDEFNRVESIDPNFVDAYNNLGALLAVEHQYAAATDQLLRALELNPGDVGALENMSVVLDGLGEKEESLKLLNQAIRLAPQNAALYLSRGRELDELAEYNEAMKSYQEALHLDPRLPGLHSSMGLTFLTLGQKNRASVEFNTALRSNSNDPIALRGLGQIAANEGNLQEAQTFFDRVQTLHQEELAVARATVLNARGINLLSQGGLKGAIAAFREVLAIDPGFAVADYYLGTALARENMTYDALAAFYTAIRLRPDVAASHYGLALLLKHENNPAAAEEFRKASFLERFVPQPIEMRIPIQGRSISADN